MAMKQGAQLRPAPAAGKGMGPALAANRAAPLNPVWSRLAAPATGPVLQRSPLSDSVKDAFDKAQTEKFETLLDRLSQSDVQAAQGDADVDQEIATLLAGRPGDLALAQQIRRGRLGDTTGKFGKLDKGKRVKRPIEVAFFKGASARRALVIAGVHGTEQQGIEVARMLITDLGTTPPELTTIVVPSLFPDNSSRRVRNTDNNDDLPTNRNFPEPHEDLAAATAAGKGTPVDASKSGGKRRREIQPENVLLLQLIERFQPERIISIHGTHHEGAAGVFFDPRSITKAEDAIARQHAQGLAYMMVDPERHHTPEGRQELLEIEERLYRTKLNELRDSAKTTDEDLSRRAATAIDNDTAAIPNRGSRIFDRESDPKDPADPKKKKIPSADQKARAAHPSVAGNASPVAGDPKGKLDHFSWSGSGGNGTSLGEYAPKRGMSVFTVEPPVNATSADYAKKGFSLDKVDAADRKTELKSYADAVRTVLLGK